MRRVSFDLKIKLPKGFEPPVQSVEMPALKRDRDRSEEEDRVWQQKKHEQALQRAKESAWAPFSRTLTVQSMAFVNEVLGRCGATFRNSAPGSANIGAMLPPGPSGEVDQRKLGSNDGWLLTPAECAFVADRLRVWLDGGGEVFQFRDRSWNLTPTAQEKDDIANRRFLYDLCAFLSRAEGHGGLEVW